MFLNNAGIDTSWFISFTHLLTFCWRNSRRAHASTLSTLSFPSPILNIIASQFLAELWFLLIALWLGASSELYNRCLLCPASLRSITSSLQSQFPHLYDRDNSCTLLRRSLWGLNKVIRREHEAQGLAHGTCSDVSCYFLFATYRLALGQRVEEESRHSLFRSRFALSHYVDIHLFLCVPFPLLLPVEGSDGEKGPVGRPRAKTSVTRLRLSDGPGSYFGTALWAPFFLLFWPHGRGSWCPMMLWAFW